MVQLQLKRLFLWVPNADWPGSSGRRVYVAKEAGPS
jgi:hypothetical protein